MTVIDSSAPGRWLLVRPDTSMEAVGERLGLGTTLAAGPEEALSLSNGRIEGARVRPFDAVFDFAQTLLRTNG